MRGTGGPHQVRHLADRIDKNRLQLLSKRVTQVHGLVQESRPTRLEANTAIDTSIT